VAAVADFHRVKTPTPLEFPPPTVRPAARPTAWDWLLLYVARPLWGFRGELAALLVVVWCWSRLAGPVGRGPAALILVTLVAGLLAVPAGRRRVAEVEHRAGVRRRWAAACRYAGLATASDRIPRIVRHGLVPAGDRLLVRLPAGSSTAALAEAAEQVAVILDVREVRVGRDRDRASLARVTVVRRDPLHGAPPLGWPLREAPRCSLWLPVPVGVDEDGHWVQIALPERNVLLGGEPGAGKSGAMALLLAAAALDPSVRLVLFDGKLVELACWAGVADRSVGAGLAEAVEVLAEVQAELDRRLLVLLANRRRKLTPTLGLPLLVVVVDELAFYVAGPDRKLAAEFAGRLRDLVARGRAAGIVVLAATQKPAAEVIPTSLRDLFGFRWALRCLTRKPPTRCWGRAGRAWATRPRRSTRPTAGSGCCWRRVACRSGCGPAGWTTTSSPPSPPAPRRSAPGTGHHLLGCSAPHRTANTPSTVPHELHPEGGRVRRDRPGYPPPRPVRSTRTCHRHARTAPPSPPPRSGPSWPPTGCGWRSNALPAPGRASTCRPAPSAGWSPRCWPIASRPLPGWTRRPGVGRGEGERGWAERAGSGARIALGQ
jgi:hypothetical protein